MQDDTENEVKNVLLWDRKTEGGFPGKILVMAGMGDMTHT